MGACYKCGGDGWLRKMIVFGAPSMTRVPVRNGNTRALVRQFKGQSTLCPICQGRGVAGLAVHNAG